MDTLPPEIVAGVFDHLPQEFRPFARAACSSWRSCCPMPTEAFEYLAIRLSAIGCLPCLQLWSSAIAGMDLPDFRLCVAKAAAGDHLECLQYLLTIFQLEDTHYARTDALCRAIRFGHGRTVEYLLSLTPPVPMIHIYLERKLLDALTSCARQGYFDVFFSVIHLADRQSKCRCEWVAAKSACRQRNATVVRRIFQGQNPPADLCRWLRTHGELASIEFLYQLYPQLRKKE